MLSVAGEETVAGGALRRWAAGIGEIKRMCSAGYRRIPLYGRYAADPRCLCFEKRLAAG